MRFELREAGPDDAAACGEICYRAFKDLADRTGFPPQFPSVETAIEVISRQIAHPGFHGIVAERGGRVLGSSFVNERNAVAGIGPVTVDPAAQSDGLGRALMERMLSRVRDRGLAGAYLVQDLYNVASLPLYAKVGLVAREPLAQMVGGPPRAAPAGYEVRPAAPEDVPACRDIAIAAFGYARDEELTEAIALGTATVAVRDRGVTGYLTALGFRDHAAGETEGDLSALICASPAVRGPGFLVPIRQGALFRACLEAGFRVRAPTLLMSTAGYAGPRGAFLPSVV